MTVLVSKYPNKIYQSLGSLVATQQDRNRADRLDRMLEQRTKRLISDLKRKHLLPKKAGEGSTPAYWEVGKALREVAAHKELFDEAELPLLWQNVKMYIPNELRYRDRGPYREHLWYCYRLASYPEELASKMSWGEWVTIFDSTGINQELRFDEWFKIKLFQQPEHIGRSWIRMFAPCVNTMLGNIYTPDLTHKELFSCYEAAWQVVREAHAASGEKSVSIRRRELQTSIRFNIALLGKVMEGSLPPGEYSHRILADAIG
jgi:hypothetical protein